ncbi:phiSA1p31-related protein [Streptomyces albidoflavus]|uniref:phiSA1p31-related protein n=1 Tax=Streptomyces albidoflavus TaxID=1886 RepID=UPI0004CA207F|nr:phiSA1p31-related protein [Streptomyces albidoflavus]
MHEFRAGDKVTHEVYGDTVFTVLSAHTLWRFGGPRGYLLETHTGGVLLATERGLSAAPASFSKGDSAYLAGIPVSVLSGPHPGAGAFGGAPMYLVGFADGTARSVPAEELTAETGYGPDAFPRGARYRDNVGDIWEFTFGEAATRDGEALMRCQTYRHLPGMPLRKVQGFYGPLTRI